MKFKINKPSLPKDYFSSLVGWTNNLKSAPAPNEITDCTPVKKTFVPLVNEKTGETYRSEYNEYSAELDQIEKLLAQMFGR